MPELPEVETIRRGMERVIVGQKIEAVEVLVPKVLKPPITNPTEFAHGLLTSTFVDARRRGKHLIFGLDSGYALYAHLNMRGQLLVAQNFADYRGKYLCVAIRLNSGGELRFHDIWTWGELRLLPDRQEEIIKYVPALATMGAEPLSEKFNGTVLERGAQSKQGSSVKTALLDQSVVAGVGNIYADEALFRSGINPFRKVGTLTDLEWNALATQVQVVLDEAVEAGGTLSDNYVDIDGIAGRYHPRVYGRAKLPCLTCGTPLSGAKLGGRSTVFCPICQK